MKLNAKQKALVAFYREAEARAEFGQGRSGLGFAFQIEDKRKIVSMMEAAGVAPCTLATALGYATNSIGYNRHQARVRQFQQQIQRERTKAGEGVAHGRLTIGADAKLQAAIQERETRLIGLAGEVETIQKELQALKGAASILAK